MPQPVAKAHSAVRLMPRPALAVIAVDPVHEPAATPVVKRGLEEEGYAVDVARTGQDGLWMAVENPNDATYHLR